MTELFTSDILTKMDMSEIIAFICGFTYSKTCIEFDDFETSKNISKVKSRQ